MVPKPPPVVFGPQLIYMWILSQSYQLSSKLHLVSPNSVFLPLSPLFPQSGFSPSQSLSLSIFSNLPPPFMLTLFPFLQSLISRVIIITIFSLRTYFHVHQNPKESLQLQRILLELVPNVKECSVADFPKALIVLDYRL